MTPAIPGGGRTRREYLKLIGGGGLATGVTTGVSVVGGWSRYLEYLNERRDRTCTNPEIEPSSSRETDDAIDGILREHSDRKDGAGIQASVRTADGAFRNGIAGFADRSDCPMTLDYGLFVGSFSKLFTAALVMRQVERDELSLDDRLEDWVDVTFSAPITVEQLLNHTSGVPFPSGTGFMIDSYFRPDKRWTTEETIGLIDDQSLAFDPGTKHEYSNANYLLLGVLLESVTGEAYRETLRTTLAETVGVENTYYQDYPDDFPIANAYDEDGLPLDTVNMTGYRRSFETQAFSAGGVLSNSIDVCRFLHGLASGEVVESETFDRMTTFVDADEPRLPAQVGYGLGLRHLRVDGEDLVGHTGTLPGYTTLGLHNLDRGYTVSILSNVSVLDRMAVFDSLHQVLPGGGD